jgi:diguanylate cyclase (GGDEF)-like protein
LVLIAGAMAGSAMRPIDVAARYGGEEFVVILPETDTASAAVVAERLRVAVLGLNLIHAGGVANGIASVSIGVAAGVPARSDPAAVLVEAADKALYDAKRSGRNRTSVNAGCLQPDALPPAGEDSTTGSPA